MGNFPANFFRPYRMTSSQLNNFPCVQGQLIFTTDSKRIYIDTTNAKTGRLEVTAEAITNVELGTDKRTLTFTKADGSTFNHKIVIDIDSELDAQSLNPVQNAVVSAAINAAQLDIEDIFEAIVALEKKNSSLEDAVEQNAGDIANNLNAIGINASNISSLQESVNNLNDKDGELQESINDVSNTLTNFQTATNNNFITVNENITKIVNGTTVVKNAENATSATNATSAEKAINDGNGKNIADTYETKANAASNVTSLQTYAETKANTALDNAKSDATLKVSAHNIATDAHNDIRLLIEEVTTRLNALANSTDVELDQMAELVEYIKDNRELIEGVTTNKINVSDIIDNLTTNVSDKPLSAAQGTVLKKLIDELQLHIKTDEQLRDLIEEQVKELTPEVVVCTSEHYESLGTTPLTDGKIYFIQK